MQALGECDCHEDVVVHNIFAKEDETLVEIRAYLSGSDWEDAVREAFAHEYGFETFEEAERAEGWRADELEAQRSDDPSWLCLGY